MITLIDLSGEKEEENNYTDIAQIDIKGTLSKAINQNKSQQPLNGTSSNSNSSNSEGSTNHRKYVTPGKLWYDKLSVVQQHQVEMDVDEFLYSGYMAAAQRIIDTSVRQQ